MGRVKNKNRGETSEVKSRKHLNVRAWQRSVPSLTDPGGKRTRGAAGTQAKVKGKPRLRKFVVLFGMGAGGEGGFDKSKDP